MVQTTLLPSQGTLRLAGKWMCATGESRKDSGGSMVKADRSGRARRSDWIEAGLWLLSEEGLASVTIDRLCGRLELTKGSFYWHFKGRQEFLHAMAAYWSNTTDFLAPLSASDKSDWEQIREVAGRVASHGFGRIDKAMRVWADSNPETSEAVKKTDRAITLFVCEKLANMGLSRADAQTVARMIVACGIGLTSIDPSLAPKKVKQMETLWLQLIQSLKA